MKIADSKPIVTGPLKSWDIFMQGYRRAQQLADDRQALVRMALEQQWMSLFDFDESLFRQRNTVIVTTPSLHITYASSSLLSMSGYEPYEVIGQTPRLFQGEKTEPEARMMMRLAVEKRVPFDSTATNYRKNGSLYRCHIKGYPVLNKEKQLIHFIAFETEQAIGLTQ